ncbi:MAG: ATP synthase F0 subunit A [Bacteroidetes bacterium GWF2_42_66]|nr:MAG: ATP synthase F0 subunit A [Bacteroidetes bacterium GWA2_42_15]OFY02893.1 MAG: ATP synthase F0 subunit A [Bacteroidetes bacterium GWE2_42_39]OFY44548.1 MAG: ATP synthase F0 subunit A [Bacteroidetes bacterium GWF2_42_66]HBL74894.1 ATP synthase F0 subunit A [Prolixibacteraceae bacterium]HCR91743.1 ATP synthase F0 subunit A [Prolixibacteraceae bacterium]
MRKIFRIVFALLLLFSVQNTFAEENHEPAHAASNEKFNAGNFIFDHISDSHYWHIITWKGKDVALPLPVILYSSNSGLSVFMSGKFHHGHSDYKNFRLMFEGENKGKIIELGTDGHALESLPLDLSITKNVVAIFFSLAIMLWVFLSVAKAYVRRKGQAPTGLQNFIEPVIVFIRDEVARPSIGEKKYERYLPYLLMVFFFILLNNLLGLVPIIPGGANVTGNITITLFLALCTFLITNISAGKDYWKHIINTPGVPWWLKIPLPIMPFVEFLGVLTKPFALMIRLFANITAGHIIALAFFSLIFFFAEMNVAVSYGVSVVTLAFTIFMTCLELLVAFVQAFVFTLLSAVFIGMAIEEHHAAEHH